MPPFFSKEQKRAQAWLLCIAMLALVLAWDSTALHAAPSRNQGYYHADENAIAIQEMRDSLTGMRHEVSNHEAEIRMFDEKLANFDSIIESVRDQLSEASKSHKEQLKGNAATFEEKITSLDSTTKGLVADLRQFKAHANEATAALSQYKQRISELEKIVEHQNQNIEHLQAAMKALMDALQVKDGTVKKDIAAASSGNKYRVKAGDNLEKIALSNHTTVKVIKELNGMTNDRIVVGKLLILPEN